jgi:hypothetical protein
MEGKNVFERFAKTKFKVVFLRPEYKTMNIVAMKVLNQTTDFVKMGTKTYKINWEFPSYNNKLDKIYFVNYESGSQILFKDVECQLNPTELDMIVSNKVLKELASGIMDNKAEKMMFIIVGGVIGLLAGLFIMQVIMQQKIEDLYSQFGIIDLINYKPLGVFL